MGAILKLMCRPNWAAGTDLVARYESDFAATVLNAPVTCLAFWRARVALWTILRALGIGQGDEVVVPAYTCEMVPAAVRFTGASCRYADVAPNDFNASPETLAAALGEQTRAIVCQHTYGVGLPIDRWKQRAEQAGCALLEDCCQLVETGVAGRGITGAASFFSTQWSKPYTTGLGGMAAFTDPALCEKSREFRSAFPTEGNRGKSRSLVLQVLAYRATVRPATRAVVGKLYRWAQHLGLVRGTTTPEEYGDTIPDDYLSGATNAQAVLGMAQLTRWRQNVEHRRMLTGLYLDRLGAMGINTSALTRASQSPALWAVPLLVENKSEILQLAGRKGLPIATWFGRTPAHIHPDTAARYNYRPGQCPAAERLFAREIHLVTSPSVCPERADRAVALLRDQAIRVENREDVD
ncbi:MAG TPA: hypothetical protein DCX07_08705 [Phycisphaerales bacterium]|nr:hypothetical protein [Phycisphaerales bacterium]